MKYRSKVRGHPNPDFSREEFIDWAYSNNYSSLHKNWVSSNYSKDSVPSVDRLKDNLPYTFSNMVLTTWEINNAKGLLDRQTGRTTTWQNKTVYMLDKSGVHLKSFHSTGAAHRATNVGQSHISDCCTGKRKSAGGYTWTYVKPMTVEEVDEQLTLD